MSGGPARQRRERAEALAASKPQPAEYNAVVASARIQTIRLASTTFDVKPAALSTPRSKWDFRVADELRSWECDNEARLLSGEIAFSAVCKHRGRNIVNVQARYVATFRLSQACDDEAAGHFMTRVSRFMCYPYFRAAFAALTEQSGLLLPPLPIIEEQPRLVRKSAPGGEG